MIDETEPQTDETADNHPAAPPEPAEAVPRTPPAAEDSGPTPPSPSGKPDAEPSRCYSIRFREGRHVISAISRIRNLRTGELTMAQTDHGLEPARVVGPGIVWPQEVKTPKASCTLVRRANREEMDKFTSLIEREKEAHAFCQELIAKHKLDMKLISVERYFNGSKILFYFTAEARVDFRELVKDLVQQYRTRVEMRQIGVRHETKMVGGVGSCGRELCCASYLHNFAPVSIKMAKEQDLPLNPTKISGNCNRLLCCLNYEFKTYQALKSDMPRQGQRIRLDNRQYKVIQVNALKNTITVIDTEEPGKSQVLPRDTWQRATFEKVKKDKPKKALSGKPRGGGKAGESREPEEEEILPEE